MVGIDVETDLESSRVLVKRLRSAPRTVRRWCRIELAIFSKKLIAKIRKDNSIFEYKQRRAKAGPKTAPRPRRGALKRSLWERKGRMDSSHVEHQLGWGVSYGYVLERGPKSKRTWTIKPRGFRSDLKSRGGGRTGLKMLRFQVGNKIYYKSEVTHRWDKSQLRPHFGKHLPLMTPQLIDRLKRIPGKVLAGKLHSIGAS